MDNKLLTITVPAYNAEKFLNKGIPTMLDERIRGDIEVIIVDDGSRDNTAIIADEYEKKYPQTVRVVHKENGGHGSGVNTGIKFATGKYFCVIDADDWVDTENFVRLISEMKQKDSDLFLAQAAKVTPDGIVFGYERIDNVPYEKEVVLNNYIDKIKNVEMHNYFIKTKILRKANVRCHEHHFYVDMEYVLYSLMYVKTATIFNMAVYQYLIGRDGQSVSIASRRKNKQHYIDVVTYLNEFYQKNKNKMSATQKRHYANRIAWFAAGHYGTLLSYKKNKNTKIEMIQFDDFLREKAPEVYCANKNKCVAILRMTNFRAYGLATMIFRTVNNKRIPD